VAWTNLLIILISCATFVFARNYVAKEKKDLILLTLMVFMDSFMVMFQVIMIVYVAGFNYDFLDIIIISFLYSFLLSSKVSLEIFGASKKE